MATKTISSTVSGGGAGGHSVSGNNTGDETAASIATLHHGAAAKTVLVDADEVTGGDSASAFSLIRTLWSDVWTYIKAKTDALYVTPTSANTLTNKTLDAEVYSVAATVTAGTNAQGQGALTKDFNVITTASSNPSGATLPTATAGRKIIVVNKGANPVNIYPASGGSIDALSANAAISLPVGCWIEFDASSTTQWYSSANAAITFSAWIPTITFGGAAVGMTYSYQDGWYFRIGNFAIILGTVTLSAKGSSTGAALVAGLPVTVATSSSSTFPCVLRTTAMTSGVNDQNTSAFPVGSTATVRLDKFVAAAQSPVQMTDVDFLATSSISITAIVRF
jgi:hypothetical protein